MCEPTNVSSLTALVAARLTSLDAVSTAIDISREELELVLDNATVADPNIVSRVSRHVQRLKIAIHWVSADELRARIAGS